MNLEDSIKETKYSKLDLKLKQCRCCMKSDHLDNMRFIYDKSNKEIAEMLYRYASIELVPGDGMPEEICSPCLLTFIRFHEFCVMCAKSDTIYREQLRLKCVVKLEKNDEPTVNVVDIAPDPIKVESIPSESDCKVEQLVKEDAGISEEDDDDEDVVCDSEDPEDNKLESKTKNSIFPCPKCSKKFYRERRLEGHLRQHQGLKPAVCNICDKEFSKWPALDTHIMYTHNNAERKFICDEPDCDKSYIMKQSLTTHQKRVHTKTLNNLKPESSYICESCGKSFATIATLKKHSFIHSGQRPFKCTICPKKYITNHKLKEHMMRHEGIKNFVCPICGMRKTTMHELKIHMNYHTREKMYPCKSCTAVFSSPGNRGRHFRIVHCGIKAYQCSHCERSFGKAETLKHHVMTHTGEKPHVCTACGKRFIQLVALQTHMKTHDKSR